jgi:hypothetical protein
MTSRSNRSNSSVSLSANSIAVSPFETWICHLQRYTPNPSSPLVPAFIQVEV